MLLLVFVLKLQLVTFVKFQINNYFLALLNLILRLSLFTLCQLNLLLNLLGTFSILFLYVLSSLSLSIQPLFDLFKLILIILEHNIVQLNLRILIYQLFVNHQRCLKPIRFRNVL